MFQMKRLLSLLLITGDVFAAKNYHCPPIGPVLPAPTNPSSHSKVKNAIEALTETINAYAGQLHSSAVSVGVASIYEDKPLLDLHHTPENLDPRGVNKIDADSVYRIGSVSKTYTTLAALKVRGLNMHDPVTKYVPELRRLNKQQKVNNAITTVDWDKVSMNALASHMGGVPADLPTDITSFNHNWTELGLPVAHDVLGCAGFVGVPPCTVQHFWDNFGKRPPTFAPGRNPVYSNMAFFVMSLVIERVSGEKFEEFVQKNVLDVAGMKSTTYTKPDDSVGAIGPDDIFWNTSVGIMNPAGSYYSSTNDLLAFGSSILKHEFLDIAETNKWLKPVTFTGGRGMFLGAPWEIVRSNKLTSDERVVDVYTKGGDLGTYHSSFAMIPDYGIIISVLATGPEISGAVPSLFFSMITTALAPALEAAGKYQAEKTFAGTYANEETNSTLILEVDHEGPGLSITEWTVRGTEVSSHWLNYIAPFVPSVPKMSLSGRLYPTDLSAGDKTAWRAMFRLGTVQQAEMQESLFFWEDASCMTWALVDRAVYEFLGLDEMVFKNEDGRAGEVELVGFQTTLKRVE
ncbi:Beta-lactamase-like protein 2 [Fusarium austroafricanum]|uniref:Beta-lactamase-like protein 2 n=1 Tax=Fusarium austroafricanum TaxID=2364996 RepID=A0A8H4KML8_9HYPO|nr:Beta-lactamase-like protein 2 [Fusarium austroafricanum]